jgi:hypothetical protein
MFSTRQEQMKQITEARLSPDCAETEAPAQKQQLPAPQSESQAIEEAEPSRRMPNLVFVAASSARSLANPTPIASDEATVATQVNKLPMV